MTAATMIRELADTGIRLSADGDRLHVEAAPGALTAERRQRLIDHKAELLAALQEPPTGILTPAERRAIETAYAAIARTLREHPDAPRAIRTVEQPDDATYVLLAVAVRGVGYCTLRVPRARYDGVRVLEMLERRSASKDGP